MPFGFGKKKQKDDESDANAPSQPVSTPRDEATSAPPSTASTPRSPAKLQKQPSSPHLLKRKGTASPMLPEDDELNTIFEALLNALDFPEAQRKNMRTMSKERKIALIKQHSHDLGSLDTTTLSREAPVSARNSVRVSGAIKKVHETPEFLINQLRTEPSFDNVANFYMCIENQPLSWIQKFVDSEGILVLLDIICEIDKIQQKTEQDFVMQEYCARSIKRIMNFKVGLEGILKSKVGVKKLAMTLNTNHKPLKIVGLELLTVGSLISSEGHKQTLDAMSNLRQHRGDNSRFFVLIDALLSQHPDLQLNSLSLINALVNSPADLDIRVYLRKEFQHLGINRILDHIKSQVTFDSDPDLITQIDVFEEEYRNDQRELEQRYSNLNVNVEDPYAMFNLLMEAVKATDSWETHPFIAILRHLLSIPAGTETGQKVWVVAEKVIQQVALQKESVGIDEQLNLRELLSTATDRSNLAQTSSQIDKLNKQIEELNQFKVAAQAQLREKDKQIKELEAMLSGGSSKPNAGPFRRGTALDNSKFSFVGAEEASNRNQAADMPGRPSQVNRPLAAGILPSFLSTSSQGGNALSLAIQEKKLQETLGISNWAEYEEDNNDDSDYEVDEETFKKRAGRAYTFGGPAKPVEAPLPQFDGAVPPPPPLAVEGADGAVPPPPPMFAIVETRIKAVAKPNVKMKLLQWSKIPSRKITNTIWSQIGDDSPDIEFNYQLLEDLFAAKQAKVEDLVKSKPNSVTVIDQKKAQKIGIVLAQLKCSLEELKFRVLTFSDNMFSVEHLQALNSSVPQTEELENIRSYLKQGGSPESLGKPEQFMMAVADIKLLKERLHLMLFKKKFPVRSQEIVPELISITNASREMMQSSNLLKLMEIILKFGNFVNGGTFNENAFGFKLEALMKLTDTKAADNKTTLMHYLAGYIAENFPHLINFMDELPSVPLASKVALTSITADLKQFVEDLFQVRHTISWFISKKKLNPRIKENLELWLKECEENFSTLEEIYSQADSDFKNLVLFWGDDPNGYQPEDWFAIFVKFSKNLYKCLEDNMRERELAEKAAKRAADKEKKSKEASTRKASPTTNADAEALVDELLTTMRDGNAFKMRRAQVTRQGTPNVS